jgi:hypothetical protein
MATALILRTDIEKHDLKLGVPSDRDVARSARARLIPRLW